MTGRRLLILEDIWEGFRSQPGRMGLSIMTMAIGLSSLVVLIAILGGLKEKSRRVLNELGVNVAGIFQTWADDRPKSDCLGERQALLLAANLPDCSISTVLRYEVPTLGSRKHLTVMATDQSLIQVRQWSLEDGRFLDDRDILYGERNAVISKSLSLLWNWKVGNLIMLRDVPFKVIGIVEAGGNVLAAELEDPGLLFGEMVVFVPKTVLPYWVNTPKGPMATATAIFMRAPSRDRFSSALAIARRLLSHPEYEVKALSWITPDQLIQGINKVEKTIKLSLGTIAILCLILGGTTLMSLMVANVRDRVREIGLRRALGATQKDIALLFILEAVLITAVAALLAIGITNVLLLRGRPALPVPIKIGVETTLIPLGVALVLAILFSYWPARTAARIIPSNALRNE